LISTKNAGTVLVSVLNWNSWKNTIRCLDSLYMMDSEDFTVVVVDNASSESIPEHFSLLYPKAIIMQNKENLGFAKGHKTAIDWGLAHDYDYFWILNNDLLVHPQVLNTLRSAVEQHGAMGLYGSLSIEGNPPRPINPGFLLKKTGRINFHTTGQNMARAINNSLRVGNSVLKVGTLYGCSLFMSRGLLQKYGFMRPEFFMYREEVDYALYLYSHGVASYLVVNSLVYHDGQHNSRRNRALNTVLGYYMSRNKFYSYRRLGRHAACYFGLFRSIAHLIKNCAKHAYKELKHVPNNDLEHGLAGMLGIWHGLIGKTGRTLQPEHALKIGSRPYFGSYARSIKNSKQELR